eukprot:5014429-Pyramimonas_sp.AAC.1
MTQPIRIISRFKIGQQAEFRALDLTDESATDHSESVSLNISSIAVLQLELITIKPRVHVKMTRIIRI